MPDKPRKAQETGEAAREFLPESLRATLNKLPTPEALRIIEDLGRVAWVVDNNNNNKASVLDELILTRVAKMPVADVKRILDFQAD